MNRNSRLTFPVPHTITDSFRYASLRGTAGLGLDHVAVIGVVVVTDTVKIGSITER